MNFPFRRSPKESSLTQAGEKVASRVRASSDGSSPRNRWSPVKMTESLRRRPKKYTHLKLDSTDHSDDNAFKENDSPLGAISVDDIPIPMPPTRIRQETPPSGSGINFSLPPPSPSARRTRTPIRGSNHSRFNSPDIIREPRTSPSARPPARGSNHSRHSMGAYDTRGIIEDESKHEPRSSPNRTSNHSRFSTGTYDSRGTAEDDSRHGSRSSPSRASKHSRFSTGTYITQGITEDESKHESRSSPSSRQTPVRSSDHSRLTVGTLETSDSVYIHQSSKREPTPPRQAEVSPIFRLNPQPAAPGIETMLANEGHAVKLSDTRGKLNVNQAGRDGFAELISARRESARLNPRMESSTELHEMCYGISTLDDVIRAQSYLIRYSAENNSIADCVSKTDHMGRTPIHAFSENKGVATAIGIPNECDYETREYVKLYQQPTFDPESNLEKHVVRFLISDLLAAYPGAMMSLDRDGRIPFESALTEWILQSHDDCPRSNEPEAGYLSNLASYTNRAWGSTSTTILSAVKLGARRGARNIGEQVTTPTGPGGTGTGEAFEWNELNEALAREHNESAARNSDRMKSSSIIVPAVRLTPHARFALMMLSAIVDQLDHYMSPELFKSRSSRVRNQLGCGSREEFERVLKRVRTFRDIYGSVDISSAVVQTIASVPNLMRTILLVQDEVDREFVLSTSIIRRVMVCKHSIGPWFTMMLQSYDRKLSQRSVDYLKGVSNEFSSGKHGKAMSSSSEQGNFTQFIDEVSRLQDFIPALLALGDRGIEEASTTLIVKKVLDRIISRPFAVTVVLCDAFFLTLMILGFRSAVNRLIIGGSFDVVLQWIYVCNTGIFYFIIREIGKTVSLFLISKRARVYFLSFWNVIDILAVGLTLASTIAMRYHFTFKDLVLEEESTVRGLLAVTTGFLWLRVLSLLKAINMQLATFVLAIIQITKDITWFCVILLTLVVSFAQMFFTLLAPSSCASGDPDGTECKQAEYLLRVYTILLGDFGDFEREQFTSGFSVFLVVFYSFLVTVVLLNVLIAVASDSYEKCLVRSQNLFGRARVMLIAELVSFQNLLMKADNTNCSSNESAFKSRIYSRWWSSGPWSRDWSRGSVLFFCLSITVIVGWTLAELLGYSRGKRYGNILFSLASVLVNVILFAAIMVFLSKGAASTKKEPSKEDDEESDSLVQRAMLRLLGATRDAQVDGRKARGDIDDWNGRVDYLQREMTRIAEQQNSLAVDLSKSTENLVNQSEARLRAELGVLEENFSSLKGCLLKEVKATQSTNAQVTIAVEELKTLISMAASTSAYRSPVPSEVDLQQTIFVRHGTDT